MARKPGPGGPAHLPELELECMKVLWESGDLTVRGVRDRLLPRKPLAYTTVLTLLDRLARRGAVARRKSGRAHVYHSVYPQSEARRVAVNRLLEHYFSGSREALLEHLGAAPAAVPAARAAGRESEEPTALDPTLL